MKKLKHPSNQILWHLNALSSRVVAETGIPTDRAHLGKIIIQSLTDAPDFIMQIDGGTGERDTFRTALERSVECATALRNLGLKPNDVIALMGPNYLDLPICLYAGLYLGTAVAAFNMLNNAKEFEELFAQCLPKVIFCTSASIESIVKALEALDVEAPIITFDKTANYMCFQEFLHKYSDKKPTEEFRANELDPSETCAIIVPTSGTTGLPKLAPLTHAHILHGFPSVMSMFEQFPTPTRLGLCPSPVQWLSSHFSFILAAITRFTRLQTSLPVTKEHVVDLINIYKPTFTIISPTFMMTLANQQESENCDFSCFDTILIGGSATTREMLDKMKKILPNVALYPEYGMTEACSMVFSADDESGMSLGRPNGFLRHKLVDPNTGKDISEPNKSGELWIRGPSVFKGYFKKPELNADIFSGEWLKTGDLFYRDQHDKYFFVDRMKMLLKYKNEQISPNEIEKVILRHPEVLDAAVTGIPDAESGDLPVACVVLRKGHQITPQEIKDIVKAELSDVKQLRGGVVFLEALPLTPSIKIDRAALKKLVITAVRH